jgi:hypothetical protein
VKLPWFRFRIQSFPVAVPELTRIVDTHNVVDDKTLFRRNHGVHEIRITEIKVRILVAGHRLGAQQHTEQKTRKKHNVFPSSHSFSSFV